MSTTVQSSAVTVPSLAAKPRTLDELMQNVSASRLSLFHQCRLKFYFRYVLGLASPKSPALQMGSSDHAVLKEWNKARWRGEILTLRQLHDLYTESWAAEQAEHPVNWEDDNEEEEKKVGWRLLETYFREGPIKPDEKPEAVEVSVEADLFHRGLPNLIGIIDLVRPGGVVVDFKTSGKAPDPFTVLHLHEVQISAYGVLYEASTGHAASGFELHHLIKTKNPKLVVTSLPPMTDVQEKKLFHLMESYVEGVQRQDWVPSPSFLCGSCEHYVTCRAWC